MHQEILETPYNTVKKIAREKMCYNNWMSDEKSLYWYLQSPLTFIF